MLTPGRVLYALPAAAALLLAAPVAAQDTVYIGGSGQHSVEIDLGVLDGHVAPRRVSPALRHPGIEGGGLDPVVLTPPPDTPVAAAPRKPKPTATDMATDTTTDIAAKTETPKLKLPEPEPEPIPEPVHDAAPQPEPAPVKAKATTMAKAGKAVEEMTAEEYAAARKRNSNQVSSTSFADDDALGIDNGASAAKAPPKAQPKSEPKTAAKAPAETKTAALQPAKAPEMSGDVMQIVFPAGDSVLPPAAETPLAALAAQLAQDTSLRLQLKAYAGGDADAASHARRLSLSRALSVRSHLIEAGVRSTRIDVRALGNKSESGPADRVDVFLVTR